MGTLITTHIRPQVWHSEMYISFVEARTEQSEAKGSRSRQRAEGIITVLEKVDSTCHREEVPKLHQARHRTFSLCTRSHGCWVPAHCAKKPPWSRSSAPPTAAQLSASSRAELRLHLRPPRAEGVRDKGRGGGSSPRLSRVFLHLGSNPRESAGHAGRKLIPATEVIPDGGVSLDGDWAIISRRSQWQSDRVDPESAGSPARPQKVRAFEV